MSDCPGLALCTPTPPPAATGLTVAEQHALDQLLTWALLIGVVVVVSAMLLVFLFFLVNAMGGRD